MRVYRLIEIEVLEGGELPPGNMLSHENPLGVFSTVASAEEMIRANAARFNDASYHQVLGYVLYENELDDQALHGPWKRVPSFLSVRSYFADGSLNAFCGCDDVSERHWHGRNPDTMHYKPGDYVSVWVGDIVPALIGDTPRTTGTIDGDWTDDCYLAYSADMGHWHPFTPYVFPLVGELSKRIKAKIDAERREWENEMPALVPARRKTIVGQKGNFRPSPPPRPEGQ